MQDRPTSNALQQNEFQLHWLHKFMQQHACCPGFKAALWRRFMCQRLPEVKCSCFLQSLLCAWLQERQLESGAACTACSGAARVGAPRSCQRHRLASHCHCPHVWSPLPPQATLPGPPCPPSHAPASWPSTAFALAAAASPPFVITASAALSVS